MYTYRLTSRGHGEPSNSLFTALFGPLSVTSKQISRNILALISRVHYNDVIMGAIASQITSFTIIYSAAYSDANPIKHQSSASLAFVGGIHRWPVNSPHKWPETRKMFPFDDVIMYGACSPGGLYHIFSWTDNGIRTGINSYMRRKSMDVITYPCPNCRWTMLNRSQVIGTHVIQWNCFQMLIYIKSVESVEAAWCIPELLITRLLGSHHSRHK